MSIFRGKNTKPRQQQIFVFQLRWVYTGFKLFGADVRASYFLTKRVFKGAAAKMTKSWGLGKVVLVDFKIATEIGDVTNDVSFTGWWQLQIFFFMFTPKIGEDEPILTNIFQMGWNHQLVYYFKQSLFQYLINQQHDKKTGRMLISKVWPHLFLGMMFWCRRCIWTYNLTRFTEMPKNQVVILLMGVPQQWHWGDRQIHTAPPGM